MAPGDRGRPTDALHLPRNNLPGCSIEGPASEAASQGPSWPLPVSHLACSWDLDNNAPWVKSMRPLPPPPDIGGSAGTGGRSPWWQTAAPCIPPLPHHRLPAPAWRQIAHASTGASAQRGIAWPRALSLSAGRLGTGALEAESGANTASVVGGEPMRDSRCVADCHRQQIVK